MPTASDNTGSTQTGRLVERALGWIVEHLDLFDPFRGGQPFAIKNGQRVGELAILLHALAALGGERDGAVLRQLAALLRSVRGNPQYGDRLLRSPAEFVLFVEIYAALRRLGDDDDGSRALIQRALDARLPEQLERLPHRMMDIASCLEWGGFDHSWPSLRQLYRTSILATTPSALLLGEDGIYGLTHVIMYLYGFGIRRARIPARQRESLRRLLAMLLIGVSQDHHWDLLAELLLCWEAIGYAATPLSERCWEALLAVQNADGALPGPEWAQPLYRSAARGLAPGPAREAYFAHHYHTTLVAVIAGGLRRRNLARPPARRRASRPGAPAAPHRQQKAAGAAEPEAAAGRWMEGVLNDLCRAPRVRAEDLYRVLLGLHCAEAASAASGASPATGGTGGSRRGARAGAARVARRLAAQGVSFEPAPPPTLTLAAAAILAGHGLHVPGLHGPKGLPAQAARLLATAREGDCEDEAGEALMLYDKRLLLHTMGRLPAPSGVDLGRVLRRARSLPVTAPWEAWEDLLLRIDAATGCGTLAPEATVESSGLADLEELLAGTALRLLRHYDLPNGARVLRAMNRLGLTGEGYRDGLRFLLLHQRQEGAFGYYGMEEPRLRETLPAGFSTITGLSLPVTVECVWTLAESTGWRLVASLARQRLRGAGHQRGLGASRPAGHAHLRSSPSSPGRARPATPSAQSAPWRAASG